MARDRDDQRTPSDIQPAPTSASTSSQRDPASEPEESSLNPPRTTKGKMTAPKFGSAGSGGFELEPGPERD
jgi:hypothetical protein